MTTTTTTFPGSRCAELLFGVGLSFATVVRVLMDELDFTYVEATEAALNAHLDE